MHVTKQLDQSITCEKSNERGLEGISDNDRGAGHHGGGSSRAGAVGFPISHHHQQISGPARNQGGAARRASAACARCSPPLPSGVTQTSVAALH